MPNMILMNEFGLESSELKASMVEAAKRVIDSDWYILGNELLTFESQWSSLAGSKHAIGVGNGMDAIEIIIRSLGIEKGDEVITTSLTAFATVLAIYRSGATPVLADIDPKSGLLSIESVSRCISSKTRAVILVHLYGHLKDIDRWVEFSKVNNIFLIEDCAQAHMAASNGKVAGSFGIAGAYSFYPTKNLGALGDAGIIVTSDGHLAERSKVLRNYGQTERYYHPFLGLNSRLDEMQAAILSERIKFLAAFTNKRRAIASRYYQEINNDNLELLQKPQDANSHVYHLFVVKTKDRNRLQRYLLGCGIQTHSHYPIPIHLQDSTRGISSDPEGLANAESFANSCLSIPCHPQLSDEDVSKMIDALNKFS